MSQELIVVRVTRLGWGFAHHGRFLLIPSQEDPILVRDIRPQP
jgi:hypothetical protein